VIGLVVVDVTTGAQQLSATLGTATRYGPLVLALSPDGDRIAIIETPPGSSTATLQQYDTTSGATIGPRVDINENQTVGLSLNLRYIESRSTLDLVMFVQELSRDSRDGLATIWNATTMAPSVIPAPQLNGCEQVVALSDDHRRILTRDVCDGSTVLLREVTSGNIIQSFQNPFTRDGSFTNFSDVAFANAVGTRVVPGNVDGDVRLFDLAAPRATARRNVDISAGPVAVSPDGSLAAAVVDGGVALFNARTGTRLPGLFHYTGDFPDSFAFDPTNRRLAAIVGSFNGPARVFVWDIDRHSLAFPPIPLALWIGGLRFTFSPDGRSLTTGTDIIDTNTRRTVALPGFFVAFTPDSDTALALGGPGVVAVRTSDGHPVPVPFAKAVDPATVQDVIYSRDGRRAVIETSAQLVVVLDVPTNRVLNQFAVSNSNLLALSADGATLLVVSSNKFSAQLYDTASGVAIGEPFADPHGANLASAAFTTDGRQAVIVNQTSLGRLWWINIAPDLWRTEACDIVGRDLTPAEWRQYIGGQFQPHHPCAS
jgi:WD40 repeat protein